MNITVEIHSAGLSAKFDRAVPLAIYDTAELALAGCNDFCKRDTDSLMKTSLIHSDTNSNTCELRWVMPYAAYQYDYPGTRTERNPNARPHWCQAGYSAYGDNWQRTFVNTLHREGL